LGGRVVVFNQAEVAPMTRHSVRTVMTPEVVVVAPECGFKHIVDVLADFKVSAVPVVDNGTVIGIVSEADLLHKLEYGGGASHARLFERHSHRVARAKAVGRTARDLMTSPVILIGPDDSLATAARVMERNRVKRLPVVDPADGRLVGIVARRDLLRRYLRPDGEIKHEIVTDVLKRRLWIDPTEIHVSVNDGRVTLRGRLDRRSTTLMAARLVSSVDGVIAVQDETSYHYDDLAASEYRPVFGA
jgi:CBS domain-containing protein